MTTFVKNPTKTRSEMDVLTSDTTNDTTSDTINDTASDTARTNDRYGPHVETKRSLVNLSDTTAGAVRVLGMVGGGVWGTRVMGGWATVWP